MSPPSPSSSGAYSDAQQVPQEVPREEQQVGEVEPYVDPNHELPNFHFVVPPAYDIHAVSSVIGSILDQSLAYFVSGAPAYLVSHHHPLSRHPLTQPQILALTTLQITQSARSRCIRYIIRMMSYSTLITLQLIADHEIWLINRERTRLVLCVIIGFLAFHWHDDYRFDLFHFTQFGNLLAAEHVSTSEPGSRPLHSSLVHFGTLIGVDFDFAHIAVFHFMGPDQCD